jgi:hypothetical protein
MVHETTVRKPASAAVPKPLWAHEDIVLLPETLLEETGTVFVPLALELKSM